MRIAALAGIALLLGQALAQRPVTPKQLRRLSRPV